MRRWRDAKGLTIAALQQDRPVVIVEHRALYGIEGEVPEAYQPTPIGKARLVRREGDQITVVGTSFMVQEALHAAGELARHGLEAEIIDLRSVRPLDEETILHSIRKTGHLVVADTSWELCGVASEIAALAVEKAFSDLRRLCCASHSPIAQLPFPRSSSRLFTRRRVDNRASCAGDIGP